jgi:branched-chain amino acid transport system permease protein
MGIKLVKSNVTVFLIICLGVFLAPIFLKEYFIYLLAFVAVTFITVQGLNIMIGLTGLFSLGQAGSAAIGAYIGAILEAHLPWIPFPLTILMACLGTTFVGIIIGFPCLRLSGFYLAMGTFAFAEAVIEIIKYLEPVTGGSSGMTVLKPSLFQLTINTTTGIFYMSSLLAIFSQIFIINISKARTGRALNAIREDELAAYSMGINVPRYKLIAFAMGSLYGGLGGILYAYLLGFIRGDFFSLHMALNLFLILYVGGVGNVFGPLLGSVFIVLLPQILGGVFSRHLSLVYGVVLVIFILLIPNGMIGLLNKLQKNENDNTPIIGFKIGKVLSRIMIFGKTAKLRNN